MKIDKAAGAGFCFGVKRAIRLLEEAALARGEVATLGAIVHNEEVVQKLAGKGIRVVHSLAQIKTSVVAIGAHGVSPALEQEMRSRFSEVINTTCPFVHRAQMAARRLAEDGYYVLVYGDAGHPEVKGILGWAGGKATATLADDLAACVSPLPRRLGILSQTTQIPARFNEFAKKAIDFALNRDAELRIMDTICHDLRDRQQAALELARRVDLMLVIGSRTSANTKHLAELCATAIETYLVPTARDIKASWLAGHQHIGICGGASTAEETIDQVVARLESITAGL